ncbi:hypothetical protein ACP4OV_004154 [Aristida adscensionis]
MFSAARRLAASRHELRVIVCGGGPSPSGSLLPVSSHGDSARLLLLPLKDRRTECPIWHELVVFELEVLPLSTC